MLLCIIVIKVGGCIAGCKLYHFFFLLTKLCDFQLKMFFSQECFWIFATYQLFQEDFLCYSAEKMQIKEERDKGRENNSDKNNYVLTNDIIFSKYNSEWLCFLWIDTRIYKHSEGNLSLHMHFWWPCSGF